MMPTRGRNAWRTVALAMLVAAGAMLVVGLRTVPMVVVIVAVVIGFVGGNRPLHLDGGNDL
ncbi:MAG: hypothetical protein QOG30_2413 [Acidimicrobiaceae bacterium]